MTLFLVIFTLSAYLALFWAEKYPILYMYHLTNCVSLMFICVGYALYWGVALFIVIGGVDIYKLWKATGAI